MIIALIGKKSAGKSTLARHLQALLGAEVIAFADPLKRFCAEVFGWEKDRLDGPSHLREEPDPEWDGLTARRALQTLGTEWGRAMHPDVWARAGIRRALASTAPHVIITDCRFQNEARLVRGAGGILVRKESAYELVQDLHPSEMEQDSIEADYTVSWSETPGGAYFLARGLVDRIGAAPEASVEVSRRGINISVALRDRDGRLLGSGVLDRGSRAELEKWLYLLNE